MVLTLLGARFFNKLWKQQVYHMFLGTGVSEVSDSNSEVKITKFEVANVANMIQYGRRICKFSILLSNSILSNIKIVFYYLY